MDQIERLQVEIDDIDTRLVELLKERFQRSREIGTIKRRENQPPFNPARGESQKHRFITNCGEADLDEGMADRLNSLLQEQVLAERIEL